MRHGLSALLALLAIAVAAPAIADVPPPDSTECANLKAGDACKNDTGQAGICVASTCSRLDYSHGSPPGSVQYGCVLCLTGTNTVTSTSTGTGTGTGGTTNTATVSGGATETRTATVTGTSSSSSAGTGAATAAGTGTGSGTTTKSGCAVGEGGGGSTPFVALLGLLLLPLALRRRSTK